MGATDSVVSRHLVRDGIRTVNCSPKCRYRGFRSEVGTPGGSKAPSQQQPGHCTGDRCAAAVRLSSSSLAHLRGELQRHGSAARVFAEDRLAVVVIGEQLLLVS